MKSEHDKRGERKAVWKRYKRGKYPGAGCIRGTDQNGNAVAEVFFLATDTSNAYTTQQSFRTVTSLVMPAVTLPGELRIHHGALSATFKV